MPDHREGHLLIFCPRPRSYLTEAATLYNLVDDQLHVLVTASNHLLRRLELRVRLGHLEAAIRQVKGTPPGRRGTLQGALCSEVKTPGWQPSVFGARQKAHI